MYRRLIVLHLIVDRDAESIPPGCTNGRTRILPIDEEADLLAASSFIARAVGDI